LEQLMMLLLAFFLKHLEDKNYYKLLCNFN
jgi:hypothetical protein